jgi:putative transposase
VREGALTNRRRKAVAWLAQIHKDVFNQRNDFQHKESLKIVMRYGTIFVEDLHIQGLARGILAKSVHDASWAAFLDKISYQAENAGRGFVRVDPRGTSQRCVCGADNRKNSPTENTCASNAVW